MQETNGEHKNGLMLVGIGASAGGIDALLRFFEATPPDSGLAYAVVLHTTPDHNSHLADVLQRKTAMPVVQVADAARVEPNSVYCLPPDRPVSLAGGHIRLDKADVTNGHAPIDLFFRTLAHAYRDRTVAVVLSGAGADGSLGLGRVREEGGVSIAQDPLEAQHSQMPRSAIETGFVDFILPVALIPEKLVSLRENAERIQLPSPSAAPRGTGEDALRELLALLRARTRHDFTSYKRSTLLRRIERRLQVTECGDMGDYLEYIRGHAEELPALLRDLLISVTNFFRDPEAWQRLADDIVPQFFEGKGAGDQIRVWVPGCATGEEAYTVAMLLSEYAVTLAVPPALQVFATDIDENALAAGRAGVYPHTIAADVSVERIKRFFVTEGSYYRVRRELRETVLFAPHNVLRDPPFSKLDLISCRNLLIYINRNMQERVLEVFHFALKPNGYLFLGSSESAEGLSDLFAPTVKKYRIFKRGDDREGGFRPAPPPPVAGEWVPRQAAQPHPQLAGGREGVTYGELHYRMLEALAPPSVLVNADYEVVHMSEHAGRYMRVSGGEPSRNLHKIAHADLRLELRSLFIKAAQSGQETSSRVIVNLEGAQRFVRVTVCPVASPQARNPQPPAFMLIVFEESDALAAGDEGAESEALAAHAARPAGGLEPVVRQLEAELERTRDQLRATVEEYETSTEELKASNEELQAMNEELRSASEELETGKEELQSVNEELTTLNAELREKVDEIGRSNSDLQNLMASTRIATLFLDRNLRLKRYTPSAQELFNIIPGDVGRPLAHITNKLDYSSMVADAESVVRDLNAVEREVAATDGRYFLARLLPYRTTDDKINGVVITFTDITGRRQAEEELLASQEQWRIFVESVEDYAIMLFDDEGRFTGWNKGAEKIFGYSAEEAKGQPTDLIFTPEDRAAGEPQKELQTAERDGRAADERWHLCKDGTRFYCSGVMISLRQGRGYAKIARDLTAQKQAQDELQRAWEELENRINERTVELASANSTMREEVAERRRVEHERLELIRRIVSTQEDERRRISRELHDQLGQSLTALRLKLEGLNTEVGRRSKLRPRIAELSGIVQRLDSDVDFLAWELRPSALDDLGLTVALSNYAHEWSRHFGVEVNFHSAGLGDARLAPMVETNLYRIAQEALNNVSKHAAATRVDLLLERRGGDAVLIVEDNGRGFDVDGSALPTKGRQMGLIGMRERAALVGGAVEVESKPGEGTTVFVRVPVNPDLTAAPDEGGTKDE
ncbi:MAG TPA: chemotaxis protein CheB [Pyrinomonadaceae bacterium]|nr:chemotaxis protein CheB [Pyrinomonadaceae bacterium]